MKMKGGDVLKNLEKVFESNIVLYVLYLFAFLNIIGYLAMSNFVAVLIFLAIAYITSLFTKSVALTLLVTLLISNFLVGAGFVLKLKFKEGMENKNENNNNESDNVNTDVENEQTEDECSPCFETPIGKACTKDLKARCLTDSEDLTEDKKTDDKQDLNAKSAPAAVDAESLKNIEGLMTRAEGLMNQINKSGFKNMIGGLQRIMK